MSESTYRNFAVAGVGTIGKYILEELLNQKAAGKVDDIAVISRAESPNPSIPQGVKFIQTDYSPFSLPRLVSALTEFKIDVVICTVGIPALFAQQMVLASACKEAKVGTFIPSHFGLRPGRPNVPTDSELKEKLGNGPDGVGLTTTIVGSFADMIFKTVPRSGLILETGEALIPGDGTTPVSWTGRRDIARYIAYIVTTLPPSKLRDRTFRFEGQRISLNTIVEEYEARTGKKINVTFLPIEELEENLRKDPNDWASRLRLTWAKGEGLVNFGEDCDVDNFEYPEWNPKSVVDIILEQD